jgi:hypothetical protein
MAMKTPARRPAAQQAQEIGIRKNADTAKSSPVILCSVPMNTVSASDKITTAGFGNDKKDNLISSNVTHVTNGVGHLFKGGWTTI